MRQLVHHLLMNDPEFVDGLPGGLYGDRSIEGTPARPFGVQMNEGPVIGIGKARRYRVVIWIHDNRGDYTRIDELLLRAEAVLVAAAPFSHLGMWLNHAEWSGTSNDLYDDVRGTNVKNSTFLLVGNRL